MSYADDYEEQSYLEQVIDEEHADYAGTGMRQVRKRSTAQQLFDAQAELIDAEREVARIEQERRKAAEKVDRLRTRVLILRRKNAAEEQSRLASQPIADRDGYESAELAMNERKNREGRGLQRIVEPEPPIERGRRDRGAWE